MTREPARPSVARSSDGPPAAPEPARRGASLPAVVGNGAMQRLLSRRDDPRERQAEGIAAAVTRTEPAAAGCGCGEGGQRGSPGRIDPALRAGVEARTGGNLGDVRVHPGGRPAAQARALGARAFTVGSDIAFAPGGYAPTSRRGRRLIAHELVHVLQQTGQLGPRVEGLVQRDEEPGAAGAEGQGEGFAVRLPEPEGPRDGTPAHPRAGAEGMWFRDVYIADDREYLRGQMRRLVARRGLEGADQWYRMLHGWRPATVDLPFSAHARAYGGLRPRSPLDVQREMQREVAQERLRPLVAEVYREVRAEAIAFEREFEQRAREVTFDVLRESEARTEAERLRYGLTREESLRTSYVRYGGDVFPVTTVTYTHGMEAGVSASGLAGAAEDLKAKRDEIAGLVQQRERLVVRYYGHGGMGTVLPEANRSEHERLGREIEERRAEYDLLRHTYEERYPILAAYGEDYRALSRIATGPSPEAAAVLNEQIYGTLHKIERVRRELRPGGRVKVWKLPEIVALTKGATGAVAGSPLGEMRARVIDDKVRAVESEEFWTNIALAALLIGLSILAAIPTGGSSLVAGVGAVAALGSLGLSTALAVRHVQEYQFEQAMAGTDFDRARAISAEDPSLFWLAVDIIGVALDVGPALRGTRMLLTSSRRAFQELAPAARRALNAPGDASTELAELRRAAESVPNGGPGLATRVSANVERLRGARGSVEQLAGAAGHEARAVRGAREQVAREANRAVAQSPTRIGGHSVKVTPNGRLVRCTTCGFLREEYAVELGRNPDLARRWFDIEEAAARAARAGDRAGAEQAARRAGQLADELEAVRRTREVRAYRGLRHGAVDDLFLMDRRLVVDMPFVGRGAASATSEGWLRSGQHYWAEMVRRHPDAFSPDNLRRIRGDPPLARPLSPRNDSQFRSVFPQYDVRGLRGKTLVHHHIGGGGQAAAIPAPLHPGSGGVHNVEKAAGVWGSDSPVADVLQRLLEGTGGATP